MSALYYNLIGVIWNEEQGGTRGGVTVAISSYWIPKKKKCLIQSDFLNSQTMNNSSEKGISLKLT